MCQKTDLAEIQINGKTENKHCECAEKVKIERNQIGKKYRSQQNVITRDNSCP